MAAAALGSIVRWVLALGAGYLVKAGIWSGAEAETYVTAAALALLSLGWSLWNHYRARLKLLTALALPFPATEQTVERVVAAGEGVPTVTTPPDTVPKL